MKKHFLIVGMGTDLDRAGVEKLKANLSRDLGDHEIRIITGALFVEEVIVDLDRGRKQPYLMVGMGIPITSEHAEILRDEIRKWLPDHEVRFIVGGFSAARITIDVESSTNANQNGYL